MQLPSPELRPLFSLKKTSNPREKEQIHPTHTLSLSTPHCHHHHHTVLCSLLHSIISSPPPSTAMDTYEATKIVFSRVQSLDPDNASKIMGYILIQDQGDEEMIRLAHVPDTFLFSLINQAKDFLGLSSNSSSSSSHSAPSSPSPFSPTTKFGPLTQTPPRITIPNNNGFPSSPSSLWPSGSPAFSRNHLSYAAVVNGSTNPPPASSATPSSSPHPYYNGEAADQFEPFDQIVSPTGNKSDSLIFPYEESPDPHHQLHRRRFSMSDGFLGGSEDGLRPCMYFGRGLAKNGGGFTDSAADGSASVFGGSPGKIDATTLDELVRIKALQQQRFSQLMGSSAHHPFSYSKCMNILNDNPRSPPAALMLGEELRKFGRCRSEVNDFSSMGLAGYSNSCSRQIYLTFPADSTFSEEDVSNYFGLYGPVQDVRIPYQQKRMFGFVTFVYPETVKRILAKGNPHFVCDSRVLVKPYKEKGNIPEKKQQHQQHHMDRGKFTSCLSPSGLDSLEPHDLPFGPRMFYNSREAMLRRKLEQDAELQQAIELQGRRLMNMQLLDQKNHHNYHQFQPASYPGISIPSLSSSLSQNHHSLVPEINADHHVKLPWEQTEAHENDSGNDNSIKEQSSKLDALELNASTENMLPDSFFAFPAKSKVEGDSASSHAPADADDSSSATPSNDIPPMLSSTSALNMASLQACSLKIPKLTTGQEAIEV
ncbi:unnamed protein product [Cuscuta epithymum]|uniref:RRM domain-containing protein n=1 Tax=Cuscuta epithymum TaxID=186058 RepID=A0AAV0DMP6_9ASTE|nr:unnamed protein product [Cuscuta epithymum]